MKYYIRIRNPWNTKYETTTRNELVFRWISQGYGKNKSHYGYSRKTPHLLGIF